MVHVCTAQAIVEGISTRKGNIKLSTKQLEVQPGDMLHNREAVFAEAEKVSDMMVM